MVNKIIHLLIVATLTSQLFGQGRERYHIFFNHNSDTLASLARGNYYEIERLTQHISDSAQWLEYIELWGMASPEGGQNLNNNLIKSRLNRVSKLLNYRMEVADSLIHIGNKIIGWSQLLSLVENSEMESKEEVTKIIRDATIPKEDRILSLIRLHNGEPYRYIQKNFFPLLRMVEIVPIFNRPPLETPPIPLQLAPISTTEKNRITRAIECRVAVNYLPSYFIKKPLFALKTNLLFDALTLLNIEVEVPIKRNWSVAGEWLFPWWTWDNLKPDSKRNRIQILNGTLEGKYWWHKDNLSPLLTGWFTGLYFGGGIYDLEHKGKGYQGDFFPSAGISGGYGHKVGRGNNLRMEYSLGVGVIKTNYKYYHASCYYENRWHPTLQHRGNYIWVGPTRLKVSLSWLINKKKKLYLQQHQNN